MQIHELNNYSGSVGSGSYLVIDDGADTGKISADTLLSEVNQELSQVNNRIDNIITSPAPSEQEIIDAREGVHGVDYASLGSAIRSQIEDLSNEINDIANNEEIKYINQTITGTNYIDIDRYIPAGTYLVTIDNVASSDTDDTTSSIVFYDVNNSIVNATTFNRGVAISKYITLSGDAVRIRFLAAGGSPSSVGDTFTYSDFVMSQRTGLQAAIDNKLDSVSQQDLTFATPHNPVNMFDYTDGEMNKPDYWFYSTTIGAIIAAEHNEYTTAYHAVKCPILGSNKITIGLSPGTTPGRLFWIGAVDEDMRLLSYATPNANMPYTFALPDNTYYICASVNINYLDPYGQMPELMVVDGDTIPTYEPYEKPYYFLEDCRTVADAPPEIAEIQSIVGNSSNIVKFKAPASYDLVVGDTFQLFYKGIINAAHPENYDVLAQCTQGSGFDRYFEITPTGAGTLTLTLTLYGINHNVLDTATITLNISAKASSPGAQRNVLCVGDSLTQGGLWVAELYRRLTGSGGSPTADNLSNINFIGTLERDGAHYEGYGGWTFAKYNAESIDINAKVITTTHDKTEAQDQHSIYEASNGSKWKLETIDNGAIKIMLVSGNAITFPASGTLTWVSGGINHSNIVYSASVNAPGNPFWDSVNSQVDFAKYAHDQGVNSIDYVYVLLGWNNAALSEASYKADAQTFIDNVQASFPAAQIVLMGLQIPAKDGLAVNCGANGVYSKYWELMQFVFNLDEWYQDLVDSNSNVYAFNLSGQFDTAYNMPTMTKQVNTRNTETITMQSNGVHPANGGYLQIADAAYRDITAKL